MALVDVTELLVDPDFINDVSLIHRVPTVNSYGENTLVETTVNTVGSVQPATNDRILRLPESLRFENVNIYYIKAEIVTVKAGAYPDIIVFGGIRYEIQTVENWMNWGQGWCAGVCIEQKPAGA